MPPKNQREYNAQYYARNRDVELARVRRRQLATVEWLRELRRVPCVDCGQLFAPYVMDFDHRDPQTKSFRLTSGRALLKSRELLLSEIAKCDVVCANCHRIRTAAQYTAGTLAFGFKPAGAPAATDEAQSRRERFLRLRAAQLEIVDRVRALPCVDCGSSFALPAMELDHRDPSQKKAMLCVMAGRVRIAALLEELAKCDIVCANCHRERTYHRRECLDAGCLRVWCSGYARDPSKIEGRVRFPLPAQSTEQRTIRESVNRYRFAA